VEIYREKRIVAARFNYRSISYDECTGGTGTAIRGGGAARGSRPAEKLSSMLYA